MTCGQVSAFLLLLGDVWGGGIGGRANSRPDKRVRLRAPRIREPRFSMGHNRHIPAGEGTVDERSLMLSCTGLLDSSCGHCALVSGFI